MTPRRTGRVRDGASPSSPGGAPYLVGKLMRQAKPDDVFLFVSLEEIAALWREIEPYLGRSRPFWSWLLAWWRVERDGSR